MKKIIFKALPPFLFFLILTSCSNAQTLYEKGHYERVIYKINHLENPSNEDLLLKAKSYIALNEDEKALESLFIYLNNSKTNREYAIEHFIRLNTSDRLTIMTLREDDGLDALKELYKAYSNTKKLDKAKNILSLLSDKLNFTSYLDLIFQAPVDSAFIINLLETWHKAIANEEIDDYLLNLEKLTKLELDESTSHKALSLTDLLINNTIITEDNKRLSLLFKIKGNILNKLYDKVNARVYWNQALRLNEEDSELRDKLND